MIIATVFLVEPGKSGAMVRNQHAITAGAGRLVATSVHMTLFLNVAALINALAPASVWRE